MLSRAALRAVLRDRGLHLGKRLGQNILINRNVRDRIIEAADLRPDNVVVEIGAGTGALTEALVARAGRVIAFEIDRGLAAVLREQLAGASNLEIRVEDYLKADLGSLVNAGSSAERLVLVGNLPYSITTPIITHVIESALRFRAAFFTVQREVAQRLQAQPGSRDRGAITYLVEHHTEVRRLLSVPRPAFEPVPKVESVLIGLIPRRKPTVSPRDPKLMFRVIRTAFGARRKVLKNALRRLQWRALPDHKVADALRECGLDPKARAEQLSLRQFADLSDALARRGVAEQRTS